MPELPEVEHVVRALRRTIVGRQIVASQIKLPKLITPLKPAQFNRKIKGVRIEAINRRGKYILIELDSDRVLAVHLRMTGKFLYLTGDDDLPKHSHAIFYLDNDRRLVFRDQRQFDFAHQPGTSERLFLRRGFRAVLASLRARRRTLRQMRRAHPAHGARRQIDLLVPALSAKMTVRRLRRLHGFSFSNLRHLRHLRIITNSPKQNPSSSDTNA